MKRRIISILLCVGIVLMLPACSREQRVVTCEEVVATYEAAGYEVFHNHPCNLGNEICYIDVENAADEQIYFYFYETAEEAQADHREYNVLIWLFSVIYGDPTWVYTEIYQNILIEYTDKELYKPFAKLIK